MENIMENIWEDEAIKEPPVYTLSACAALKAASFDKDNLSDTTELTDGITERFHSALFVCNEKQLGFISDMAVMSAGKHPFIQMPWEFYPFYSNGFIYLFSWEGSDYLVLPDELADIYNKVISEADFTAISKHNQEICAYAYALLNLYGVYETEWMTEVWNHHHREKITCRETENVVTALANFHSDFCFEDGYIIHDCLSEDDLDKLLDEVYKMDYYMPAKNDIAVYSVRDIDYSAIIPGVIEMNAFLAGFITDERDLDDLQTSVSIFSERFEKAEYIRDYLEDAGFPVENAEAVAKFERLYQNIQDNTHIWELRGFTFYQYEKETGKRLKRFVLPALKAKKKKSK